jgi:addiction module HigA family antidote
MKHSQRKRMHPGYFLKQDLVTQGITVDEFARLSDISEIQAIGLLEQKIDVSKELAEKLAAYFGTSVALWLGLQTDYDNYRKQISD